MEETKLANELKKRLINEFPADSLKQNSISISKKQGDTPQPDQESWIPHQSNSQNDQQSDLRLESNQRSSIQLHLSVNKEPRIKSILSDNKFQQLEKIQPPSSGLSQSSKADNEAMPIIIKKTQQGNQENLINEIIADDKDRIQSKSLINTNILLRKSNSNNLLDFNMDSSFMSKRNKKALPEDAGSKNIIPNIIQSDNARFGTVQQDNMKQNDLSQYVLFKKGKNSLQSKNENDFGFQSLPVYASQKQSIPKTKREANQNESNLLRQKNKTLESYNESYQKIQKIQLELEQLQKLNAQTNSLNSLDPISKLQQINRINLSHNLKEKALKNNYQLEQENQQQQIGSYQDQQDYQISQRQSIMEITKNQPQLKDYQLPDYMESLDIDNNKIKQMNSTPRKNFYNQFFQQVPIGQNGVIPQINLHQHFNQPNITNINRNSYFLENSDRKYKRVPKELLQEKNDDNNLSNLYNHKSDQQIGISRASLQQKKSIKQLETVDSNEIQQMRLTGYSTSPKRQSKKNKEQNTNSQENLILNIQKKVDRQFKISNDYDLKNYLSSQPGSESQKALNSYNKFILMKKPGKSVPNQNFFSEQALARKKIAYQNVTQEDQEGLQTDQEGPQTENRPDNLSRNNPYTIQMTSILKKTYELKSKSKEEIYNALKSMKYNAKNVAKENAKVKTKNAQLFQQIRKKDKFINELITFLSPENKNENQSVGNHLDNKLNLVEEMIKKGQNKLNSPVKISKLQDEVSNYKREVMRLQIINSKIIELAKTNGVQLDQIEEQRTENSDTQETKDDQIVPKNQLKKAVDKKETKKIFVRRDQKKIDIKKNEKKPEIKKDEPKSINKKDEPKSINKKDELKSIDQKDQNKKKIVKDDQKSEKNEKIPKIKEESSEHYSDEIIEIESDQDKQISEQISEQISDDSFNKKRKSDESIIESEYSQNFKKTQSIKSDYSDQIMDEIEEENNKEIQKKEEKMNWNNLQKEQTKAQIELEKEIKRTKELQKKLEEMENKLKQEEKEKEELRKREQKLAQELQKALHGQVDFSERSDLDFSQVKSKIGTSSKSQNKAAKANVDPIKEEKDELDDCSIPQKLNKDISKKSMQESELGQMVMPKFPSEITGLKFENDFKFNQENQEIQKEQRDQTSRSQSLKVNCFESTIEDNLIVSNQVQAENAQRILNQLDEIPSESKYSALETEANMNETNKQSEQFVDDVELDDPQVLHCLKVLGQLMITQKVPLDKVEELFFKGKYKPNQQIKIYQLKEILGQVLKVDEDHSLKFARFLVEEKYDPDDEDEEDLREKDQLGKPKQFQLDLNRKVNIMYVPIRMITSLTKYPQFLKAENIQIIEEKEEKEEQEEQEEKEENNVKQNETSFAQMVTEQLQTQEQSLEQKNKQNSSMIVDDYSDEKQGISKEKQTGESEYTEEEIEESQEEQQSIQKQHLPQKLLDAIKDLNKRNNPQNLIQNEKNLNIIGFIFYAFAQAIQTKYPQMVLSCRLIFKDVIISKYDKTILNNKLKSVDYLKEGGNKKGIETELIYPIDFINKFQQISLVQGQSFNEEEKQLLDIVFNQKNFKGLYFYKDILEILEIVGIKDQKFFGANDQSLLDYNFLDLKSIRLINRLITYIGTKQVTFSEFMKDMILIQEVKTKESTQNIEIFMASSFFEKLEKHGIKSNSNLHPNLCLFLCIDRKYKKYLMIKKLKRCIIDFNSSLYFQSVGLKKLKEPIRIQPAQVAQSEQDEEYYDEEEDEQVEQKPQPTDAVSFADLAKANQVVNPPEQNQDEEYYDEEEDQQAEQKPQAESNQPFAALLQQNQGTNKPAPKKDEEYEYYDEEDESEVQGSQPTPRLGQPLDQTKMQDQVNSQEQPLDQKANEEQQNLNNPQKKKVVYEYYDEEDDDK